MRVAGPLTRIYTAVKFPEEEFSIMKSWIRRFGILTVLGCLMCGALVAGCGGGDEGGDEPAKPEEKKEKADDAE